MGTLNTPSMTRKYLTAPVPWVPYFLPLTLVLHHSVPLTPDYNCTFFHSLPLSLSTSLTMVHSGVIMTAPYSL